MGRWGQRLFEGDMDLDVASDISEEAGLELLHYNDPKDGTGLVATRIALNDGRLGRMFENNKSKKDLFPSNDYYIVILGALAMSVGATIEAKHLDLLRNRYKKIPVVNGFALPIFDCGFRTEGAAQFEKALKGYKNDGTPWDFSTLGPAEHLENIANQGHARKSKLDSCNLRRCSKQASDLPDNKRLRACAKCHKVVYCSKECQKADWKEHKKCCGHFEAADAPADSSPNTARQTPVQCLNQ